MAKLIKKIRTADGDLQIDYTALANLPESDTTLSTSGAFADAKTTGDKIKEVNTKIDNLTNGTTTAPTISATDLKAKTFTLDGSSVESYDLTMGSVASGKVLSTQGAINLAHSHAVIVNDDGTITLGEVSTTGGNFKIADTKAYKDGVSAAIDSVTLSAAGWDNGNNVVTASNGKSVTVSLPSFSTSGGTSFDSSNKTTVSFSTPSVSTPLKTVEVDASSVYTSGQAAGVDSVTLSKSWSSGTITVKASNGKTSTATLSKGTETWSSNTCSFPVMDGSTSTGLTCSVDASARYNAGANSVTVPSANIVRNADDTYNSSDHSTTVTIKATASNGKSGTQTFTVSGTSAYNAGYSAGSANGTGEADFISYTAGSGLLTPKLTNGKTHTYYFSASDATSENKIPILVADNSSMSGSSTLMNVDASDVYSSGQTAGANAVTLSKSWSGGIFTVTASNGKSATSLISQGTATLDGNVYSFPIMYDTNGNTGYTCTIDATARYDAGVSSVTVPNTNIVRQAADYYTSDSNHSTTVYIRATASNGAYGTQSFSVSGTSAYNAGVSAGKNAVTISSISTGTIGSPTGSGPFYASLDVTATASNSATKTETKSINVTQVYSAGYNAGYEAGFAAAESQYTAGTYYKGNGSTVYARGTSVTPTQRTLYVAPTSSATAVTVYDVGSSSTLYKGNGGSYVSRGDAVTAYIKAG